MPIKSNKQYDLNSKFNYIEHYRNYICYCEVAIDSDGNIEYCIPSHQEYMIKYYCEKHSITREQFNAQYENDIDWFDKILNDTNLILVWYDRATYNYQTITENQYKALQKLIGYKCIKIDSFKCGLYDSIARYSRSHNESELKYYLSLFDDLYDIKEISLTRQIITVC